MVVCSRDTQVKEGFEMKKILILAILLMILAAPVLAARGGVPNYNSGSSIAGIMSDEFSYYYGDTAGFSEIGVGTADYGGHNSGLSWPAQQEHKPS